MDAHKQAQLEQKREAIRQHKDYVLVRRRFPQAPENEIFKAFIKGQGQLRHICQLLAQQYPQASAEFNQMYSPQQRQGYPSPQAPYAGMQMPMMNQGPPQGHQAPQGHQGQNQFAQGQYNGYYGQGHGQGQRGYPSPGQPQPPNQFQYQGQPQGSQGQYPQQYPYQMPFDPSINPELEDDPHRKRQKVAMPMMSAIPSTKVEVKKKQSILDKYKTRPQRLQGLQQGQYQQLQQGQVNQFYGPPGFQGQGQPQYPYPPPGQYQQPGQPGQPGQYPPQYGYQPPVHTKYAFKVNSAPVVARADGSHLDILEERIKQNSRNKSRRYSDEWSDDSDDSDDDGRQHARGRSTYDGVTSIDGQVVDFVNTASTSELMEIGGLEPAVAELVIAQRPYPSIYAISENDFPLPDASPKPVSKKGKGKKKPLGLRLVEATEHNLRGYKAVDSLVKQCAEYGERISAQMKEWGVTVTGEGEMSTVEIDPLGDSGQVPYIKHKPALLGDDITLNNYQQVGINWLNLLYQNKLSCILADEMGLGKTCQVISFMAHLKATEKKNGPHLVIVPASTIENWLREFNKFCPSMVVQAYYGSVGEREELRASLESIDYDVMVTTYSLAAGSAADFKFLRQQNFNIIVYDEGHFLKNSLTERYNKLMRLQAKFRLLLTGTPLQNNLKELVSLLSFMLPKVFNEKREDLQNLFNQKLGVAFSSKSQSATPTTHNPLMAQQAISKAKTMMTPFVLRRKKEQVLQHLPAKCHEIITCEMMPAQRKIYEAEIDQARKTRAERERRAAITDKAELDKLKKDPLPSSTNVLMQLRKAVLHPMLFRVGFTDEKLKEMAAAIMAEPEYVKANQDYIYEDMTVMSDYELNNLCEKFPTINQYKLPDSTYLDSGKVTKLLEVLDTIINTRKEKVLVFSLFTQVLDVLEKVLAIYKYKFVRLDGATSVETRQDIIDSFYEDDEIPIFLLSTKAGGFGINLVAANNVIIFDQSFNPHDDKQAEDRAHRVGQTKEVTVYKLITNDSIEQNILHLAENKLQLDEQISAEGTSVDPKFEEKQATMWETMLFSNGGPAAAPKEATPANGQ
ncbi:ATP-dependent helicase Fun30p [Diutina catenulata]